MRVQITHSLIILLLTSNMLEVNIAVLTKKFIYNGQLNLAATSLKRKIMREKEGDEGKKDQEK